MGLSRPLLVSIFPFFSWHIARLLLIIFTMVNDNRKQIRRRKSMHCSTTSYYKTPDTQWEYIDSNSDLKKLKSILVFKPGLRRQNASVLPLVPPPLPQGVILWILLIFQGRKRLRPSPSRWTQRWLGRTKETVSVMSTDLSRSRTASIVIISSYIFWLSYIKLSSAVFFPLPKRNPTLPEKVRMEQTN